MPARPAEHQGARRPRLGQPAGHDRSPGPGPGLLRRGDRGRRAAGHLRRVALLPRPDGLAAAGRPAGAGAANQAAAGPGPAWWRSGGVSLPSVAAPLLVLPAAILMTESILLRPLYVDRYVLYGEAGAALLAGAGLYRIGRWPVTRRPARARLAAGRHRVPVRSGPAARAAAPRPHGRGAAGTTTAGRRATWERTRGRVTGSSSSGSSTGRPSWVTQGDFRNTSDFAQAASPLQVGNFQGRDKPDGVTLPLMLGYRRIWVYGARPSLRRPEAELRAESAALLAATPWSGSASSTASWSRSGCGAEAPGPSGPVCRPRARASLAGLHRAVPRGR